MKIPFLYFLSLTGIILAHPILMKGQVIIGEFSNPSFEDSAQQSGDWPFGYRFPFPWWQHGCSHNGDNTPDWQPGHEELNFPAQDGNRYMAIITRPNGYVNGNFSQEGHSEEAIGHNFPDFFLEEDTHYYFSLYLANNFEGSTYEYAHGRAKLSVYIHPYQNIRLSSIQCIFTEAYKLWESPLIDHRDWRQYHVSLAIPNVYPSGLEMYQSITLKAEWIEDSSESGHVLIDNLSPIYKGRLPALDLGDEWVLCQGDTAYLNAADPQASPASYEWDDGSTEPVRAVTEDGTYHVRVYGLGFELFDTVEVSFERPYPLDIGPDTLICVGDTLEKSLEIWPNRYEAYWQDSLKRPSYTITEPGVYYVRMEGKACIQRDSLVVQAAVCAPTFIMSNIFSPNGDQINDLFLPVEVTDITQPFLRIWDRWGRICYESRDLMQGWDGTLNGNPCKEGVYYWQCQFENVRGERFTEQGTVTLLR